MDDADRRDDDDASRDDEADPPEPLPDGGDDAESDDTGWEFETDSEDAGWGVDDDDEFGDPVADDPVATDGVDDPVTDDRFDDPAGVDGPGAGPGSGGLAPWAHAKILGSGLGLVVLAFLLGFAAILLIALVLSAAGVEITDTTSLFVSLIGIQGIGFPLAAFGYLAYTDRDAREFIPVRWPSLKELGIIVGAAIGALVLVILFANIVLTFVETEPASNTGGETVRDNPGIVPYLIPFVFLLNGPGEELLFRGVLQGRFRETYGPALAIVLASLMFAPAHILSLSGSIQAAALTISFLTVPSLVFGAVYEYTDNFVVPALVHSIYNSILFGSVYLVYRYGPDPEQAAELLVL